MKTQKNAQIQAVVGIKVDAGWKIVWTAVKGAKHYNVQLIDKASSQPLLKKGGEKLKTCTMGLTSLKTQPPKDLRLEIFASDGKNAAGPTTVVAFKTTKTGIVDLKVLTAEQLKTLKHDDAANPNGTGRQPSTPIEQPVKVPTTPPPPANVPTSEEKLAPAIERDVKAKIHEQTKTEKITWQELDPEKTPEKALSAEKSPHKRSVSKKLATKKEKLPKQKPAASSSTAPPLIPPTSPAGRALQRFASFFTWRRIIMAVIWAILLAVVGVLAKAAWEKYANSRTTSSIGSVGLVPAVRATATTTSAFVPAPLTNQVIVIEQKLDETTKQALRSVGTVPSGSYLEQPVINLNFTNSFNGNRSRFEFNYRSGNGNGSGNGSWNAIGNGDFSSRPSRSRYINVPAASPTQAPPAPMPAPQTSQWSPAPTQGWYVPPPQDQPMQSSVGQAAPTYSAPYAYNVSYSYVPPINFGFSWGGGHYGGRGH